MDAAKHLKGLGWRGEGHSLDSTNRGLRKPLLISNRRAHQGLGSKTHKEKQADQWWLNAFDNALKQIGTGQESNLATVAKHGVKLGGLYGFFVRGEQLTGTIQEETTESEDKESEESEVEDSSTEPSSVDSSDESDSNDSESDGESESDDDSQSDNDSESETDRSSPLPLRLPQPPIMGNQRFGARSKVLQSGSNAAPLGANRRIFGGSSDLVKEPAPAPAPAPIAEPVTNGTNEKSKSEHKKRKREEPAPEVIAEAAPEPKEPESKKSKIVDGIVIPAPKPIIREKKKKESAGAVRERRKQEKAEQAKQNFLENRKKAIEEGTFDYEADQLKKKERELERMVNEELERREKAGEFGPILPHPSILLRYEKEVEKELKRLGKVGDLELEKKLMHDKVNLPGLDRNRKIKYKEEKYKREKLKREAKREIKGRMRSVMFGEEYIPDSLLTEKELKAKKKEEKEERKAERRAKREQQAVMNEAKEANKAARRAAKLERRERKKENRRQTAEALAALKGQKVAPEGQKEDGQDVFQAGSDEIKLGLNIDGRQRTIPGVGAVSRYPTKAEKALKKRECQAFELGISLEEYDARVAKEKAEKEAPEQQRVSELQKERGGLNSKQWFRYCWLAQTESQEDAERYFLATRQKNADKEAAAKAGGLEKESVALAAPSSFPKPDAMKGPQEFAKTPTQKTEAKPLSEKKKAKYAAKAEKKGITLEEYIAKKKAKEQKKEAKEANEDAESTSATTPAAKPNAIFPPPPSNGVTLPKTIRAPPGSLAHKLLTDAATTGKATTNGTSTAVEAPASGFVVDTAGDPHLNNTAGPTADLGFVIDSAGDPDILTRPKSVLIWHPDMLGDRKIKELSKEERNARLEWMRARRAARHAAEGKVSVSKKDRHKARVEKKQKQRDYFVAQIMNEKGRPREEVSKEELEDARRKAKRAMREIKREKRNKVIHRKKLGGGLRGQFGGTISMGGRNTAVD